MAMSQLDANQVIKLVADETNGALKVNLVAGGGGAASTTPGYIAVGSARNDYSTVNVTTSAYVQLIASTSAICQEVEIFDSSGQTMRLATGGSGSEVDQIYIMPGGNGRVRLQIAAGTRISIKAVSATANSGEIDINLYG